MDTMFIITFVLSNFGFLGFVIACDATHKLKKLEKEIATLNERLE